MTTTSAEILELPDALHLIEERRQAELDGVRRYRFDYRAEYLYRDASLEGCLANIGALAGVGGLICLARWITVGQNGGWALICLAVLAVIFVALSGYDAHYVVDEDDEKILLYRRRWGKWLCETVVEFSAVEKVAVGHYSPSVVSKIDKTEYAVAALFVGDGKNIPLPTSHPGDSELIQRLARFLADRLEVPLKEKGSSDGTPS